MRPTGVRSGSQITASRMADPSAGVAVAADEVADERGGGEHGPRRDLAGGDGVEDLAFGEPVQVVDQIRAQERKEHVAAAEDDDAELGELGEHLDAARPWSGRGERGHD